MSKLLDKLKADQLHYRKLGDKHAAQSLTTLIGELQTEEKRGTLVDDAKVTASIKKTIEGLKEVDSSMASMEITFLEEYLPKQLTEDQLRSIIESRHFSHIGEVMKELEQNYAGQYDGKLASQIAKEVLQ